MVKNSQGTKLFFQFTLLMTNNPLERAIKCEDNNLQMKTIEDKLIVQLISERGKRKAHKQKNHRYVFHRKENVAKKVLIGAKDCFRRFKVYVITAYSCLCLLFSFYFANLKNQLSTEQIYKQALKFALRNGQSLGSIFLAFFSRSAEKIKENYCFVYLAYISHCRIFVVV